MSLTAVGAAARVHEALDDLASDLTTTDDQAGRDIGDYTYPLEAALRDCSFSDISEATSQAQERAVLAGLEYHTLNRLVRKYMARTSQQQGAGASGMHLAQEWAATAKTLRGAIAAAREVYESALSAIGIDLASDPSLSGTTAQPVLVDRDRDVGAALLRTHEGAPWFVESEYQS